MNKVLKPIVDTLQCNVSTVLILMMLCCFHAPAFAALNDGLVAYYPFNGNANDESGNNHNGIVNGATLTTDISGKANSAYSFDGNQSIIQIDNNSNLKPSKMSISVWIKNINAQGWARIVDKYRYNEHEGYNLIYDPASSTIRFEFWGVDNNKWYINSNSKVENNSWHHIVVTYDGSIMKMFYDGKEESSAITNTQINHTDRYLSIGNGFDDNMYWPFSGVIDETRIYNRALTAAEVTELYSQGQTSTNVALLLHGMNSNAGTWNSVVNQYFSTANCPSIYNGKISAIAKPNPQNTYCYRINFGSLDAGSPDKGLQDAWTYGESNGYASAGDYSTFNQLGTEVDTAITKIRAKIPNAKILLVAHSRGGLAARAFLQQPVSSENKNSVVGLITTGTPHNGSRIGRIYPYIQNQMLKSDGTRVTGNTAINDDWQAVDLLDGISSCNGFGKGFRIDPRRPVVGYLADNGTMIRDLNTNKANLPALSYGEIVYGGSYLGKLDPHYNLFDEPGVDVCDQVSTQAEAFIKGGTAAAPTASTSYMGDGIVTAGSQGANVFPTAFRTTYGGGILHVDEPKKPAHIAAMSCRLGFPWFTSCGATAQAAPAAKMAQKLPSKAAVSVVSTDFNNLTALSIEQLWQDYLAVITDDSQANQREQFATALGIKLRQQDNAAFYPDLEQHLLNPQNSKLERARLAKLLAEIATPQALDSLTQAFLQTNGVAIQTALSHAILNIADSLPEQPRRVALSNVLETAWLHAKTQKQLETIATALAKLGTAQDVELLLSSIEKNGGSLPDSTKKRLSHSEKQAIASFNAMDEIINPDSETVLENAFTRHTANEAAFIAAGNGLTNLGRDNAALRVLQRVHELPDNVVANGERWLNNLSGKIEKTMLRKMKKAVVMPRHQRLRQQMEEITQ